MGFLKTAWAFAFGISLAFSTAALGEDEATLGPKPRRIVPIVDESLIPQFEAFRFDAIAKKSDLEALIGLQTPVKSQGGRGTCSIFSASAMVESLLKMRYEEDMDLSENYLEYLVMSRMKNYPSEGSDTDLNIPALARYGTIEENVWPYETQDWTEELSGKEKERAEATCGELKGKKKTACLLSHMDPDNDRFARKAKSFRNEHGLGDLSYDEVSTQAAIKRALNKNQPLILSLEFFYGAWNHRKMEEYGIGDRDMEMWEKGVVGTPTKDDIELSRKHGAGHSFVVVGYNDKERVYYFKNSWGTTGFGVSSDLLGGDSTAGYGTITYEYAHNFGTFYSVEFSERTN